MGNYIALYIAVLNAKVKREQVPSEDALQPADWPTLTYIAVLKTRAVLTFSLTVTTDLMNVVDNVFHELRQTGVGSETKSYSKGIVLLWFLLFH